MQIKNKTFPYPILNNNKLYSNFKESNFEIKYEIDENKDTYILKDIKFSTNSKLINSLYDNDKISVFLIIECSDTVFREKFKIGKIPSDIKLLKSDFSEKVDVSMFAVAAKDFVFYSSDEFDDDYSKIKFEIEKYNIICANDGFNIAFKHDESESNLIKSIFSIIPNEEINDDKFKVDCEGKKITISLSFDNYEKFKIINNVSTYKEIVFNMLLIPSLIEGLSLCKVAFQEKDNDIEEVGNYYVWFRSILSQYKKIYNKDLTPDDFFNVSPVLLAQKLLGEPLSKALENIVTDLNKIEEEE